MGFLRRLLGGADPDSGATSGRADDDAAGRVASEAAFDAHSERARVSVWLRLVDPAFENAREQQRLFALENGIMRALDESAAGEHDTNALEHGFLALRLVGDDADAIVTAIGPMLADAPTGSYLAVRRGPSGAVEERVDL
jgi:hypothetical protein